MTLHIFPPERENSIVTQVHQSKSSLLIESRPDHLPLKLLNALHTTPLLYCYNVRLRLLSYVPILLFLNNTGPIFFTRGLADPQQALRSRPTVPKMGYPHFTCCIYYSDICHCEMYDIVN